MDVNLTILALEEAEGTKNKQFMLSLLKHNSLWIQYLKAMYDPGVSYYVHVSSKKKMEYGNHPIDEQFFENIRLLASRQVTGNEAKDLAKILIKKYGQAAFRLLDRSLKCGIGVKSINTVYGKIIDTFESMKGTDCEIVEWPVLTSIKYDGVKMFVRVEKGRDPLLMTSTGNPFVFKRMIDAFKNAEPGMYEGELIYGKGKMKDRPVITGILNSMLKGTIDDPDNCSFVVYDYIPLDHWDIKNTPFAYSSRYRFMMQWVPKAPFIRLVDHIMHHSLEEVVSYFESLIFKGYEGTMHRYAEDHYAWERITRLVKKKSIRECILRVYGVIPHSNPKKGRIGSLQCRGLIYDKTHGKVTVEVDVGSGLHKEDINRDPTYFIGKAVEVLYNSVTITNGMCSLFLPRYKRISKV